MDNDGWKDLFVAQGHVMDNIELTQPLVRYLEPPLLMRNQRGKFADVSKSAGTVFLTPLASRGAAFGDLDNDGAVDVVINNNNGPALVLRNAGTASQWIGLELTGVRSNRDAIGAEFGSSQPRANSPHSSHLRGRIFRRTTRACSSDWVPRRRRNSWRSDGHPARCRKSRTSQPVGSRRSRSRGAHAWA